MFGFAYDFDFILFSSQRACKKTSAGKVAILKQNRSSKESIKSEMYKNEQVNCSK